MIYDIHVHQSENSFDSKLKIKDALLRAKKIGLDGICFTDHDDIGLRKDKDRIEKLILEYGVNIIVGVEIFTLDGDLLCFGIDEIPKERLSVKETIKFVEKRGGVSVAAHPFRNSKRGLNDNIYFNNINGIEVFNGRTDDLLNTKAFNASKLLNKAILGGSDAHTAEEIGKYATKFESKINCEDDFIKAIKENKTTAISLKDILNTKKIIKKII
ncbi:PHP domain-containing protein [Helicovermis profundi]|uniref:PHP domain-containing protein n=1 Tax=Helicovermis profundi TaxID=3065157 RepID=A0AAU9EL18_9FIRM|nr:PHP domain-containing protein [Clostridia bacterium S502]